MSPNLDLDINTVAGKFSMDKANEPETGPWTLQHYQ